MYKLYLIDCEKIKFEDVKWMYQFLPEERKVKTDKLQGDTHKVFSVLEYFVVKKLVKAKGLPNFTYNKYGKPALKGCKKFNVSNSKNVMVVAISDDEIGVDIQFVGEFKQSLANYVCSKKELNALCASEQKEIDFTKLWTKKESFIKLHGSTIGRNLKTLLRREDLYKFDHYAYKDYQICVCQKTQKYTKNNEKT